MASIGNPKALAPYMNSKDCSLGFCSVYCPQWCYMVFPPPPPAFQFPDDDSSPDFSPLVIAIIGILASAFLLMSYYTIISKYCGNTDSPRRASHGQEAELEENRDPTLHEPWHAASAGLDEALVKSITALEYKKGDGLIEGTDCSVCLSKFEEDERLRLLPKCSHAFHMQCIDTWLKSHSNCPLCRASIALIVPAKPGSSPLLTETPPAVTRESETVRTIGETVIDVRSDEEDQRIRRSVSMNYLSQNRVSVADILSIRESEGDDGDAGSSKQSSEGFKKCSNSKMVVNCGLSPVEMKRSFSSGRFFMTSKHGCRVGRGKAIIHV